MRSIKAKLNSLPKNPGVYLFKNSGNEVVYVGKAKNLRNRVRSYFSQSYDLRPRTQNLITAVADLEYIICDTETEALMLENNLIKKHQPRYNILLKDDKNYQFIKIDYSTQIPQICTVRKIENWKLPARNSPEAKPMAGGKIGNSKYFGPYTSGQAVRATLQLLRSIVPYCANKKISARPCFYYHLGRCPGVCFGAITLEEYGRTLKNAEKFLKGDFKNILRDLGEQMKTASARKEFERAARFRDRISALKKILERQKIMGPAGESFDAISAFTAGSLTAINLFQIREGRLLGKEGFLLENTKDSPQEEVLKSFLEKYYLETSDIPPEINLPGPVTELQTLQILIGRRLNKKVKIAWPSRGRRRKIVKLGETNARDFLEKTSQNLAREQALTTKALFELQNKLQLPSLPLRIECYDISNIQGTSPTGSMVVFENGKPKKSDYKRFAVRAPDTPNDVAMMKEVLERRFAHSIPPLMRGGIRGDHSPLLESATTSPNPSSRGGALSWRLPDLIVVDGGRPQLNTALAVLKTKNLKLPAIGLAKRLEEIYLSTLKSPLRLPGDSAALHLLQRVRDEAHRFAVSYHRKKRSKKMLARFGEN